MFLTHGLYVGDGAVGRLIATGMSGQIHHLKFWPDSAVLNAVIKTASMALDTAWVPGVGVVSEGVNFVGADFTVDDGAFPMPLNTVGVTYYYEGHAE